MTVAEKSGRKSYVSVKNDDGRDRHTENDTKNAIRIDNVEPQTWG